MKRPWLSALQGFAAVTVLWLLAMLVIPARLLPSPWETVARMVALFASEELALHLGASLTRIFASLLVAAVIGIPIGVWTGLRPVADSVLGPVTYVLYPVPKIALLPVLILLLGIGNVAKISLVVIIIVFQLLLAARDEVRQIPSSIFTSARSLSLTGPALLRHVVLPGILPRLFSALRLSLGISFSVIFFAESFATVYGVGSFIVNAWAQVAYLDMYAGIVALAIAGFLLFRVVDVVERAACPWLRR